MFKKLSFIFIIALSLRLIIGCDIFYSPKESLFANQQSSVSSLLLNRQIRFSGYDWIVRNSNTTIVSPGPNLYSNSISNVWIDSLGFLHLKIRYFRGSWYSSKLESIASLGYGSYIFNVEKGF